MLIRKGVPVDVPPKINGSDFPHAERVGGFLGGISAPHGRTTHSTPLNHANIPSLAYAKVPQPLELFKSHLFSDMLVGGCG